MKVNITMERTIRVSDDFEVTEEQLQKLKNGDNIFFDELYDLMRKEDANYDYAVCDEEGRTIVDWR